MLFTLGGGGGAGGPMPPPPIPLHTRGVGGGGGRGSQGRQVRRWLRTYTKKGNKDRTYA